MMVVCLLAVVVYLSGYVTGDIPNGYILEVSTKCGTNHVSDALITVVTDLPGAEVTAVCPGVGETAFNTSDQTTFALPVSYPDQGSYPCIFTKRAGSETYVVLIIASYGQDEEYLEEDDETFTVSCTFGPKSVKRSHQQNVIETMVAPIEYQVNKGPDTTSSLSLSLIDILGDVLDPSEAIIIGRKVRLLIKSDGREGDVGLRPTSCSALAPADGSSYSVLRAGCGDGLILPRHSGFKTTGMQALSTYFDMFVPQGETTLAFECNVTFCQLNCDGNSCVNERRRRNAEHIHTDGMMIMKPTETITNIFRIKI